MEKALPLVASFFSSCTGGHRLPSRPVADRPHPDTSGAEPLPPSRVQIGIAARDDSALRPTVSGNIDDLDHATIPLRTHAVGTLVAPGHAVRIRSNARGPHTRHRILDLASEAARQCARVRATVVQVPVALLAAAPPLTPFPVMPGDLSPEPWPTTPLFQPSGLQPFAVPAGAYQDQGARYKYKVHRTSKAGYKALLRQSCYGHVSSWGCRDRRQTTDTIAGAPRFSHRRGKDRGVW